MNDLQSNLIDGQEDVLRDVINRNTVYTAKYKLNGYRFIIIDQILSKPIHIHSLYNYDQLYYTLFENTNI